MTAYPPITIGIDASNLTRGGGSTHLIEILAVAQPENFGINTVFVWGGEALLSSISSRPWLQMQCPTELNANSLRRNLWARTHLTKSAKQVGCDLLFSPGGRIAGNFRPTVTMSRNMLPFEPSELRRYRFSLQGLRLLILRRIQTRSFKRANGLIFLNEYARDTVSRVTGAFSGKVVVIPHGRSTRFEFPPKRQLDSKSYSAERPMRLLYVSTVDQYKHQWNVVEAVSELRKTGIHLSIDFVGAAYPPSLKKLQAAISTLDPAGNWAHYCGEVPYRELHSMYESADIGVFASSCENMPNILLENMAAGLPIASSNRGPMPSILGDSGVLFDPESPTSIANALSKLVNSTELRWNCANRAFNLAKSFSWQRCSNETFAFLASIALECKTPQTSLHIDKAINARGRQSVHHLTSDC